MKVPLNHFIFAEEIAGECESRDPPRAARDAIPNEAPKTHLTDACDKRCEGPQDWGKASNDDGLAPVPLIERLGTQQVFLIEQTTRFADEYAGSDESPNGVVGEISQDRRSEEQRNDDLHIEGGDMGVWIHHAADGTDREQQ